MIGIRFLLITVVAVAGFATNCNAQSFHTAQAKSPDAGTMFVYPERIPLKAGGMFTAQRGLMFVPLNREKADSDVIAVEFYRFPCSRSSGSDAPPLFLLNGGPGFPGLEESLKREGTFEQQIGVFSNNMDVVVVGQRGIGSSKPNTLVEQSTPPRAAGEPYDESQAKAELQKVLRRERKFWLDQGVDLTGFNVLECAADVRDVAAALGYKKITIAGGSFGSHWGMAIMRRFPDLVERALLSGMEGPDHTWDHPGWYWNVYKRVAEDAEASERLKEHIPEAGLIKTIESIVSRATESPFTVTVEANGSEQKVLLDGYAMRYLARGYSGGLRAWPADVMRLHHGDFDRAARRVLARSKASGPRYSTASYWMLDSGSGITAKRRAEFESDAAMKIIGSTFWQYAAGSPVWETDLGDAFRENFETNIPTVIVHGTWDTSTPYENALELVPYFKSSKFVTVKRGSHGAMLEAIRRHPQFAMAVMQFLTTGETSALPEELELPMPRWVVPQLDKDDKDD